jgi:hypothetical protein
METESKIKRKRKETLLLTGIDSMSPSDIILTIVEIKGKLKKIFKNHIGRENAINPYDLFISVFNIQPNTLDIFQRNYWYSVLKRIITQMRREEEMFIINNGYHLFVLQTQEEEKKFDEKIDRHIDYLKDIKKKARKWVRYKKWKKIN